jgi:Super-infection exclusion protein B
VDFFKQIVEAFKLGPYVFFAVALASGAVLFGSPEFAKRLGVDSVLAAQRVWVGGTFLLSSTLFVSSIAARFWKTLSPILVERWNNRQRIKTLLAITAQERDILAEYVRANTSTRYYPPNDGVIGGLVGKGILYRSSNIGSMDSFPYNVQPWAWKYLERNAALVLSAEEIQILLTAGPEGFEKPEDERDFRFR